MEQNKHQNRISATSKLLGNRSQLKYIYPSHGAACGKIGRFFARRYALPENRFYFALK
jgi:hypothetical protein